MEKLKQLLECYSHDQAHGLNEYIVHAYTKLARWRYTKYLTRARG